MTIGLAALGVAAVWAVGAAAAPLFAHLNGPQRTGFAYGVGLVWVSIAMGAAALVGVPLNRTAGMTAIVGPAAGWWLWRAWQRRRAPGVPGNVRYGIDGVSDPLWWGGAAVLAAVWMMVTARAVLKPIQFWDAWATYAFKAKVIFLKAAIPPPTLFGWGGSPNYPDYPLGVSLQEVWVAWFVGGWDDVAVKLLFPAYLLSLLFLTYGFLRERWDPRSAMLGTLFAAGLPLVLQHGHDGYTDLPFAYFALGGATALTRYLRSGDRRDVLLAAVFAVGLVWTRVDGVILVACNALGLVAARRASLHAANVRADVGIYLALPTLVWGVWTLVKIHFGVSASFLGHWASTVPLVERASRIAGMFFQGFFLDGNWLILWALFALAVVFRSRETVAVDSPFLFWPVVGYLGSIGVLFATTGLFRFLEDGTVLHRLVLHVAPVAALWVAAVFGRQWGLEGARGGRPQLSGFRDPAEGR